MSCSVNTANNVTTITITLQSQAYTGRGCHGPVVRAAPKLPGKLLQCRAKSDDFCKKLLPRFILSDELYEFTPEVRQDLTSTSGTLIVPSTFLSLPFEILAMIYKAIESAPTQVALALTCRHMAIIAKDHDLNLSHTSPKYAGFLPRNVFDVPDLMRTLSSWMPSHLQLCAHCLTMRPSDPQYWSDVDGCETGNFWTTKTGWHFHNASWHKQVHDICPACHLSCSMSDYVDCDGCRVIGRLGDVDWSRVTDHWRRRNRDELGRAPAAPITNPWDLNA